MRRAASAVLADPADRRHGGRGRAAACVLERARLAREEGIFAGGSSGAAIHVAVELAKEVGAGKTIVALLAAIVAMENGLQVAFMAPTEILCAQHYGNIVRLLAQSRYRVDMLTGSTPGLQKHTLHSHIERGTTHLIVGTHALVQETIRFHRLGLVIIDEQHRFGVAQRAALRAKGLRPDVLLMKIGRAHV